MDHEVLQIYISPLIFSIKAKLQETNPKRVDVFMKDAQAAVKMIMENFMNYQVRCCTIWANHLICSGYSGLFLVVQSSLT